MTSLLIMIKLWRHSRAARIPTAFLVRPDFPSCFLNSIETRFMFSISKISFRHCLFAHLDLMHKKWTHDVCDEIQYLYIRIPLYWVVSLTLFMGPFRVWFTLNLRQVSYLEQETRNIRLLLR